MEASLYNEFKDSPAPKNGTNTTATRPSTRQSRPPATAAAPTTTSNWMTGLSQAFSSFTGGYSANTATTAHTTHTSNSGASNNNNGAGGDSGRVNDVTASGFKPRELRPKQTQEDVNRRLSGYQGEAPPTITATTTAAPAGGATSAEPRTPGAEIVADATGKLAICGMLVESC